MRGTPSKELRLLVDSHTCRPPSVLMPCLYSGSYNKQKNKMQLHYTEAKITKNNKTHSLIRTFKYC